VVIHGDLHLDQFLFHVGVPRITDWDRVARGPAAEDLGSFRAHLVLSDPLGADEAVRAFETGYASRRALPDRRTLDWFEGMAILRLLEQPLRRGRENWREAAANLLAAVERRVESLK
jgi:aminoglycoside phosphotransferase (APT) family kinase protein